MPTPYPAPERLALPVSIDGEEQPGLWRLADITGPVEAIRDLFVATPPGYDDSGDRRYPVVYLQDGQNLFDPATSYAGHWGMLETLAEQGTAHPAIIVGIPNLGPNRLKEYSPFDDPVRGIGEGVGYLKWVTGVVKPRIDALFRTLPSREQTAVGGSSMGGLFATYAILGAAATFGSAWIMSPALWYADGAVFRWLGRQPAPTGRIWLDVGAREGEEEVLDVERLRELLVSRGWKMGSTLRYLEDPNGEHDEASWGRRVRENWATLIGMIAPKG